MYEIFEHLMRDRPDDTVEFITPRQSGGLWVSPQAMFYENKNGDTIPVCPWESMAWEYYNDRCAIHRVSASGWFLKVDDLMYFTDPPNLELDDWVMGAWCRNFYSKKSLI